MKVVRSILVDVVRNNFSSCLLIRSRSSYLTRFQNFPGCIKIVENILRPVLNVAFYMCRM